MTTPEQGQMRRFDFFFINFKQRSFIVLGAEKHYTGLFC